MKKLVPFLIALFVSSHALAFVGQPSGSFPMGGNPSAPAICAANGFNTNTFYDSMVSPSTIDLQNTQRPGFKWYVQRKPTGSVDPIVQPSDLSFGPDGVTFTSSAAGGGSWLTSLGQNGTTAAMTGAGIAATGGYFEATISVPAPVNASCPYSTGTFWLADRTLDLSCGSGGCSSQKLMEVDIAEQSQFGACQIIGTSFNAYLWQSGGVAGSSTHTYQVPPGWDITHPHRYGMLWLTMAQNGGTGSLQWYFDGNPQGSPITYTAGGNFSQMETSKGFSIILQSGLNWPGNIH